MSEVQTLYRLLILYMLQTADRPLSNTQITSFMLEQEYARYFSIQQAIHELESSGLLTREPVRNNTLCRITEEGRYILEAYQDEIADMFKLRIEETFRPDSGKSEDDIRVLSSVYPTKQGGYNVSCQIREGEEHKMDLVLNVPTKEQAEKIEHSWKERYIEAYASLVELLTE